MPVELQIPPITSKGQRSTLTLGTYATRVRAINNPLSVPLANALDETQQSVNAIEQALRNSSIGQFTQIYVKDATGKVIGWIGSIDGFQGGWFQNLYVGSTGPDVAPFWADVDGNVFIGQHGSISVLDPGGNAVAWIGEQTDVQKTILTATNATPIVIGVTAHGYVNGDTVLISGCTGNTAANGSRIVKNRTANTFEITTLAGADVSGNGAYGGSGKCARYFGGAWLQTVAVGGTGFGNAKLRAFANGDLDITDALITLYGTAATITLDPVLGQMTIVDEPSHNFTITLTANSISMIGAEDTTDLSSGFLTISQSGLASDGRVVSINGFSTSGFGPSQIFRQGRGTFSAPLATLTTDPLARLVGKGTYLTGGGSGHITDELASMEFAAGESFTPSANGTDVVFYATANGAIGKAEVARFYGDKIHFGKNTAINSTAYTYALNVGGDIDATGYRSGGTAGITGSQVFGVSISVTTASVIETISTTSGSAITSVDFGASSTTSGSFITGITGNPITAVTAVTLTTKALSWKTGLITSLV